VPPAGRPSGRRRAHGPPKAKSIQGGAPSPDTHLCVFRPPFPDRDAGRGGGTELTTLPELAGTCFLGPPKGHKTHRDTDRPSPTGVQAINRAKTGEVAEVRQRGREPRLVVQGDPEPPTLWSGRTMAVSAWTSRWSTDHGAAACPTSGGPRQRPEAVKAGPGERRIGVSCRTR